VSAWFEIVSFHVAVFVFTAIVVLFGCAASPQPFSVSIWLCLTVAIVVAFSAWTGAYSKKLWERAAPHGPAIVLLIGHIAPIAAVAIYIAMIRSGNGSGVVFLPLLLWAGLFYLIGIPLTVFRLAESTPNETESDS